MPLPLGYKDNLYNQLNDLYPHIDSLKKKNRPLYGACAELYNEALRLYNPTNNELSENVKLQADLSKSLTLVNQYFDARTDNNDIDYQNETIANIQQHALSLKSSDGTLDKLKGILMMIVGAALKELGFENNFTNEGYNLVFDSKLSKAVSKLGGLFPPAAANDHKFTAKPSQPEPASPNKPGKGKTK